MARELAVGGVFKDEQAILKREWQRVKSGE